MSARDQLIRAGRGSVVIRILSLGATLAGSVVLARVMGPTQYGIYAHVFAIISLLLIPAQFGIPILIIRETARADSGDQLSTMKGLWAWASVFLIGSTLLIGTIAGLVVFLNRTNFDQSFTKVFYIGLLLLPLMALGDARAAALRGLRLIVLGQLPESIIRPIILPASVFALWLLTHQVSAASAITLNVFAAASSFFIGAAILIKVKPAGMPQVSPDYTLSHSWWRAATSLAMVSGLQLFNQQVGIVLLGAFMPSAEVGVFRVASSASTLALFGTQTISLVAAPYMARLYSQGDRDSLQKLVGISTVVSVSVSVPIVAIFVFGGHELVDLLYGQDYLNAWGPLLILVVGQAVGTAFGPAAQLLNMSGHERAAFVWLLVAATLNVLLSVLLIPKYGMFGAAWATTITRIFWSAASWQLVRRYVDISGGMIASSEIALQECYKYYRSWRA